MNRRIGRIIAFVFAAIVLALDIYLFIDQRGGTVGRLGLLLLVFFLVALGLGYMPKRFKGDVGIARVDVEFSDPEDSDN